MEGHGKLKQGDLKEQEEYKRLMEENVHLQAQIQSMNQHMKDEQVNMERSLEDAMKANVDLKRKKDKLEGDYKEQ